MSIRDWTLSVVQGRLVLSGLKFVSLMRERDILVPFTFLFVGGEMKVKVVKF